MKFPLKISNVSCSIRRNLVCVTGGFLENGLPNTGIFMIDFSNKIITKLMIELERPIEDKYPICLEQKGILCYSPPKLLYVRQDKNKTFTFVIPTLNSDNNQIAILSKSEQITSQQHDADLSINLLPETTQGRDISISKMQSTSKDSELLIPMTIESLSTIKNSPNHKQFDIKIDYLESSNSISNEKIKNHFIYQRLSTLKDDTDFPICDNNHDLL